MRLTLVLILLCIIGFLIPFFVQDVDGFFNSYGFSAEKLVHNPYILLTSIFLHGNLEHLLSNILILFFFGIVVEKEIGKAKMLALFFGGAFIGDLLSIFFYPSDVIFIGASAGIFALIGAGMLIKPLDLSFYPFIVPIPLALLGMAYAFFNIYAFLSGAGGNISYISHIGGLVVGVLYGFRYTGFKKSMKILITSLLLILILLPLLAKLIFH